MCNKVAPNNWRFEVRLALIKPWINLNLKSLNALFIILTLVSICRFAFNSSISSKISKILSWFGSKVSFKCVNRNKLSFSNILFLKRRRVAIILFLYLVLIFFILAKQQDGWNLGCMSVVVKLKLKRFTAHPLLPIL